MMTGLVYIASLMRGMLRLTLPLQGRQADIV